VKIDADGIRDLYGTTFALEDVKITLRRDINLKVAGIRAEGRHDEMINMPRWIAKTLESEGLAAIDEPDMVVELKQAIVKENVQGVYELSALDPHFYIKMRSYLSRLEERDLDRVKSMLNTLVRKRQGKIVRLADSSSMTADLSKRLTVEEKELYNEIHHTSMEFVKSILEE